MVSIENVDLRALGVDLPSDRVGVVVAQPFLSLTSTEPFVCPPQTAASQLATIQKTLEIAKARPHRQAKTHFTIFPEYCVPALPGVAAVDSALGATDWLCGTVVIGGLTALTKSEYAELLAMPNTSVNTAANGLEQVKESEWLNCSIVWVKGATSVVEKWVQPKLHPAWPEQRVHYRSMFRGGSIFIFRGRLENGALYRFSTLTCFDWIATVDNAPLWRHVLQDLAKQAEAVDAEYALSWLFVIQYNEKPNHEAFLSQIPPFFDERSLPTVRRDRTCVIFANSAGKPGPGKTNAYGHTSLVFSAKTGFAEPECPLTFASGGPRFRSNSTTLSPYRDIVFRESGACILSFVQVNPGAVAAGPANRTIAVERAEVFPIGNTVDPRAPSDAVPASVKWFNDQLDELESVAAILPTARLRREAAVAHDTIVKTLRTADASAIVDALRLANDMGVKENADTWNVAELQALSLLVNATEILAIGFASDPMTAGYPLSTITIDGHTLAVVTVRGRSHRSCLEHAAGNLPNTPYQFLLITRDHENTVWDRLEDNFLRSVPRLGMEKKITDPGNNTLHLSYQELLTIYRNAATVSDLQEAIHAKLR